MNDDSTINAEEKKEDNQSPVQKGQKEEPIDHEDWKKKAEEYLNGWKRSKADLINFQRETEKRQTEFFLFAEARFMMSFLSVYESIEKAYEHLAHEKEHVPEAVFQGLEHVKRQCDDFLKQFDVHGITTDGQSFNPQFHEAVGQEKREGVAPGSILREIQKGYLMHGKVLRPSKVIVAE